MAETRLEVIYNVTSTTYTTQLFNVTGNFVKAELGDGTQLPDSIFNQENKAYLFDQTGLTSVYYTLCGNTLVGEEFQGMARIVGVNVPTTVSAIPQRCFRNCSNLSDAYITSSVTSIGDGAFENTAIEFFEIPATSVTIGDRVFAGCSALTALTVYATTAPSVSQYTFYQVHTGGTLTYPSGSDYSSWLSNNEYYLGYYGWTGETSGGTVTATSLETTFCTFNTGSAQVNSGNTPSAISYSIDLEFLPENATLDGEVIFGNNDLFDPNYSIKYGTSSDGTRVTRYMRIGLKLNGEVNGYSDITVRDKVSNISKTVHIYNRPSDGYISPSAATFSSGACTSSQSRDEKKVGDLIHPGFTPWGHNSQVWLPNSANDWWKSSERPYLTDYSTSSTSIIYVYAMRKNTGSTRDVNGFIQIQARESRTGNVLDDYYIMPYRIVQEGSGSTPTPPDPPIPTGSTVDSGSTSHTVTYSGCPLVFDHSASTGTWNTLPTVTTAGTTDNWSLTYDVPANDTDSARTITYYYLRYSGETCEDLVDTVSYTISQNAGSGSTPTPSASISFRDSTQPVSYANVTAYCYLTICGCTLDRSRDFEIVSLTGDLPLSADTYVINSTSTRVRFKTTRNPGSTQRSSTVVCRFYDTSGNSYTDSIVLTQTVGAWAIFEPQSKTISSSAQTACVELLINSLGEPYQMEISYSGLTGFTEFPAQNWNGNTLCMDIPENQTSDIREIFLAYQDVNNTDISAGYYLAQEAAPVQKNIALNPLIINASSADTSGYTNILTTACTYSSYTITNRGGQQYTIGDPVVVGNQMRFTFPQNTGSSRSETFSMQLFDTEGNSYNTFLVVSQEAKGTPGTTPDPWSDTGDTAYTWYKDDSLLRVLPPTKMLSYNEETAYWPVTAHTFNNVGVRASGDVVFTYELLADGSAEYNSHSLYAYTEDNTGTTQQVSTIKLVAFSGSSAYSASTVLMKNPDSHGWITASPNPVNGASSQNSVNVYLTLTNCERNISKETTDNAVFDAATWVSVSRLNNTALTFNFQANNLNQARSTYYYAYGLDNSGNNVYCRIDITQEANSMGITIIPDRTSLGKPAGSFTARVESTENGNFSFSASSWMVVRSYVPESQKAGTLYVDYYENTGDYTRIGDITVSQQISTAPYILTARTQISQTSTADTAYIRVTPSSISVDRTAGVVEAQVSYAGLATVPVLVQNEGNMSIVSYNLDSGLITIAYGANDTSMDKYKNFTVTAMSSNGNVIEANFTITQGGTGLPVAPIWRDYVITVPTPGQGYINYNINYDGTVVYTGRAYGMGQDNIEIYYNHLCKPFLSNHIDFTEGYQSIRDWLGNFIITSPELGDITSVSFYEDYSYVNRDITNVMSLNNPIINEVVEGSYVPFSFFITGTSGNVSIMQNGQQITGLTVNDNEQHRYFVEAEKGKAYSSLGAVYKTIPVCSARYSLYYINSYGGVDVLPFKGKSFKKTDNITRLNYSRSFRNNTLEFENVNYMNEMKPAWELNTSYMVDSQSRKMHELVESTCVYLYDAEEQTYTPVVMTDKKLEYKTFYNQGRRFYTYTINVEESQSKERR